MCTAISDLSSGRHLFGRTLDLEYSYGEQVVIAPCRFEFDFKYYQKRIGAHPSIIGAARVSDGYPLFYDAVNKTGLAVAALNFPRFAHYSPNKRSDGYTIASYELIPWVLCQCDDLKQAKELLLNTEIVSDSFSDALPSTPLHWLIADSSGAIAVEPLAEGLKITDDPLGVLTNSPPFDYQLIRLADIMGVSPTQQKNALCPDTPLPVYSRGLGGVGLPGDLSSASRMARAVFAKTNTQAESEKTAAVSRFFHVMDTVSQPNGCVLTESGRPVRTVYTSCVDTNDGSYYFTTYRNRRIRRIDISRAPSDTELFTVDMDGDEDIKVL